ncbi:unnamed protein product [Effrenium voratum]|nr:unnamed protein product [Effrenium voratum]
MPLLQRSGRGESGSAKTEYVKPRRGAEPGYYSYLDSMYSPPVELEGPLAPVMPDYPDDWRVNSHKLFEGFDEEEHEAAPATKDWSDRGKYVPVSSRSTSDTDGQGSKYPSKGSAKHRLGVCKPCAFVFKTGCNNGFDCEFCHLCDPGEKKRRKKERKQMRKIDY